jgi:hypothetical protein
LLTALITRILAGRLLVALHDYVYGEHIEKGTTDAVEILHRRFYEGKPERLEPLEETRG